MQFEHVLDSQVQFVFFFGPDERKTETHLVEVNFSLKTIIIAFEETHISLQVSQRHFETIFNEGETHFNRWHLQEIRKRSCFRKANGVQN